MMEQDKKIIDGFFVEIRELQQEFIETSILPKDDSEYYYNKLNRVLTELYDLYNCCFLDRDKEE